MSTNSLASPGFARSLQLPVLQSWEQWQREVLALLRDDLGEVLGEISLDDVDWPQWHEFYLQGRTPRAAINRALERDL